MGYIAGRIDCQQRAGYYVPKRNYFEAVAHVDEDSYCNGKTATRPLLVGRVRDGTGPEMNEIIPILAPSL